MQVTIDIEPGTYSLLEKIKNKGLSLDEVLHEALEKVDASDHPQRRMTSDEWIGSLKSWATGMRLESRISNEDLRRENLYEDRT